jgi:hypothetical protein
MGQTQSPKIQSVAFNIGACGIAAFFNPDNADIAQKFI